MKSFFTLLFICLKTLLVNAQDISGQIIDKNTKEAIPYVTIQLGLNKGTISNEEGYFNLNIKNISNKKLTISCMGYLSKIITFKKLKDNNNTVTLEKAINTLEEVILDNKTPSVDSILSMVNLKFKENYSYENKNHKVFFRESKAVKFTKIEGELKKAKHLNKKTIQDINENIKDLSQKIKNTDVKNYFDLLGNLYINNQESSKLIVNKATDLIDIDKNYTSDAIQENIQTNLLKALDTTKTFKLKTGIIKIDDSISFKKLQNKKSLANEHENVMLKNNLSDVLQQSSFHENSFIRNIINTELYDYEFEDFTFYNNELVYVIAFKPKKSKSKFSGKLYITEDDYAVLRLDYHFAKGKKGTKVNLKLLLGIKYAENINNGTILYTKNDVGTYTPIYIKKTTGTYVYISRPLKFIENSILKYKTKLDLTLELNELIKNEILFINTQEINKTDYNSIQEKQNIPYLSIEKYNPEIWKNEKVLEPLIEMKKFGSVE